MIDIKDLRENPDVYKENIVAKNRSERVVDEVLRLDAEWRGSKAKADNLRHERNKISEQINQAKKNKDEKTAKELIKRAQEIPQRLKDVEAEEKDLLESLNKRLAEIPNLMARRVPLGKDANDNKVAQVYGKAKKAGFEIKSHVEIAEKLGIADFEAAARVAGTGFYYLQGDLALLNQALINYARDFMMKRGFLYVETPLILNEEVIDKVTDLNDKNNQIYLLRDSPQALIGTSEHSLIGRFVGQEVQEKHLPVKHTSYSMCFRKEIGSHGIDEKGLFRTHQFNKVEMIVICKPEESTKFFEEMQKITVDIFKALGIPIRVLRICSGDLGDLKHEQVDIEAYSPRKKDYFEVGSCSNLTDCQARKLGISAIVQGQRLVPHTLNNTAIATSRALVAILENYQQKDGSIKVPGVLVKYMGGKRVIGKPVKAEKKVKGKAKKRKRK